MTKMRLTTLNLDEECIEILGREENKSRYARECIKRYHGLSMEFDDLEDMYTEERYGLRDLCRFIMQTAASDPHADALVELIAEYMGENSVYVYQLLTNPYPETFLKEAAIRRGKA